jgi:hypothetical protein
VVAPVEKQLTPCELVKQEIAKYPGWDANKMFAIAKAENQSCSPSNHNLTASETHRDRNGNVICVGSYGVLQVGCLHYTQGDSIDDLATNVRLAHKAWSSRQTWGNGYEAWTQYKNGEYRKFL